MRKILRIFPDQAQSLHIGEHICWEWPTDNILVCISPTRRFRCVFVFTGTALRRGNMFTDQGRGTLLTTWLTTVGILLVPDWSHRNQDTRHFIQTSTFDRLSFFLDKACH